MLGSFLLVIFYLIIMSYSTRIESNFYSYLLVPLVYYCARMYPTIYRRLTYQFTALNPSTVLANQIFYGVKYGTWGALNEYWAFIIGPLLGTVVASFLFSFLLLPIHRRWITRKR